MTQFLFKAVSGQDIVLKSKGTQLFSYCYVMDAVDAMLHLFFNGESKNAYNVSGKDSDVTLLSLAKRVSEIAGFQILEVFLIRNCTELLKGRMEKIRDDIAEGAYDFFLETQSDCPGSYPQMATAELDEKRQWSIQEQVVTLQPEFASLGKYESFTDFIEDADQMETVVFGGNCFNIVTDVWRHRSSTRWER